MSEKENNNQEIENLNVKLNQLAAAYNELKTLNHNDAHQETLREGFLVKAGKNTETILKYICKVKNITVTPRQQFGKPTENRVPMLYDYIFQLKEKGIINEDIHHHLEIIKKWRNRTAHDLTDDSSPIDYIKDSTIESVNDSFNYFKNWFFKNYLKDQYVAHSNNYDKKKEIKEKETEKRFENNPLNIPDFSILKQSKEYKNAIKKKKQRSIIVLILIILGASFIFYYLYSKKSNESAGTEMENAVPMNKEQVYVFLSDYFDKSNSKTIDVHQFFADKVEQYITFRNLTPDQITKIKSDNVDYIDAKNTVEKESLFLHSKNGTVSYWRFWTEFICFRPKKNNQFSKCKVLMEFGINTDKKITSVRQIEYTEPVYSKKRPQ